MEQAAKARELADARQKEAARWLQEAVAAESAAREKKQKAARERERQTAAREAAVKGYSEQVAKESTAVERRQAAVSAELTAKAAMQQAGREREREAAARVAATLAKKTAVDKEREAKARVDAAMQAVGATAGKGYFAEGRAARERDRAATAHVEAVKGATAAAAREAAIKQREAAATAREATEKGRVQAAAREQAARQKEREAAAKAQVEFSAKQDAIKVKEKEAAAAEAAAGAALEQAAQERETRQREVDTRARVVAAKSVAEQMAKETAARLDEEAKAQQIRAAKAARDREAVAARDTAAAAQRQAEQEAKAAAGKAGKAEKAGNAKMDAASARVRAAEEAVRHRAATQKAGTSSRPAYWSSRTAFRQDGFSLVRLHDPSLLGALGEMIRVENASALSRGRDVREPGSYTALQLAAAWRVENPFLWDKFVVYRAAMASYAARVHSRDDEMPRVQVRPALVAAASGLEERELVSAINETYLMHGTRPETVLTIVRSGLNERFSGGHFGSGSYLAEVSDKINQYVSRESKSPATAVLELHEHLYADDGRRPDDPNVYYGFVCRAALGHFVRTMDGETSIDGGHPIFAKGTSKRELAAIPESPRGTHYHSMLVEIGGKVKRHREFVVFHSDTIYPEYLVAFHRV